jgi:hypothetical protein
MGGQNHSQMASGWFGHHPLRLYLGVVEPFPNNPMAIESGWVTFDFIFFYFFFFSNLEETLT